MPHQLACLLMAQYRTPCLDSISAPDALYNTLLQNVVSPFPYVNVADLQALIHGGAARSDSGWVLAYEFITPVPDTISVSLTGTILEGAGLIGPPLSSDVDSGLRQADYPEPSMLGLAHSGGLGGDLGNPSLPALGPTSTEATLAALQALANLQCLSSTSRLPVSHKCCRSKDSPLFVRVFGRSRFEERCR